MQNQSFVQWLSLCITDGCQRSAGQSVWTWITWIMANGTFALHLYIVSGYRGSDMVWLTLANVVMCCICLRYVIQTQRRAGTLCWVPFRKPRAGYVLTVRLADDLRHPMARWTHTAGQPLNAMVADAVRQYLSQTTSGIAPPTRS